MCTLLTKLEMKIWKANKASWKMPTGDMQLTVRLMKKTKTMLELKN
jgi:hypothetical protein